LEFGQVEVNLPLFDGGLCDRNLAFRRPALRVCYARLRTGSGYLCLCRL